MSGFDPTWLSLREPYDHAVRDLDLTAAFAKALGPSPRLIDLGCGTGSNLRYLAPHLPAGQSWLCIDHDPELLERLEATKPLGIHVETLCLDLAGALDDVPIERGVGVTAAALLDLTSKAWLERFAERCRQCPVLMTLSVDGEKSFMPSDPLDGSICEAFWRHQKTDKGFGPSLGPDAARYLKQCFQELGHQVQLAKSDWAFSAEDGAILPPLLEGIAGAVSECRPDLPAQRWLDRRLGEVREQRLAMTVGHEDLLALPG